MLVFGCTLPETNISNISHPRVVGKMSFLLSIGGICDPSLEGKLKRSPVKVTSRDMSNENKPGCLRVYT